MKPKDPRLSRLRCEESGKILSIADIAAELAEVDKAVAEFDQEAARLTPVKRPEKPQ